MKKVVILTILALVSAPTIQAFDAPANPRHEEEEERGLFDMFCSAVPYFLSAGALYFCYKNHKMIQNIEKQFANDLNGLKTENGTLKAKLGEVENKANNACSNADFVAEKQRVNGRFAERPSIVVGEQPPRSQSVTPDPVIVSDNEGGAGNGNNPKPESKSATK